MTAPAPMNDALRKVEAEAQAARHVAVRFHEALDALPEEDAALRRAARRLSEAAEDAARTCEDARTPPAPLLYVAHILVAAREKGTPLFVGWAVPNSTGAHDFLAEDYPPTCALQLAAWSGGRPTPLTDVAAQVVRDLPPTDRPREVTARRGGLTWTARFQEPPTMTAAEVEEVRQAVRQRPTRHRPPRRPERERP